jgi:glycosyltransferase involved in cell wall biosynthesis
VGIVRDIEKSIEKDISTLTDAFLGFDEINWFLVESGSSDRSKEVLRKLAAENSKFNFVSIKIQESASRTENMARARNRYLEYLKTNSMFKKYSYVVMADFNNLNNKLSNRAVQTCFKRTDWDVVAANQSGRYYDIWALRHPLWSPNDCWEQHSFYRRYTKFPERAITYAIRSRMIKIPRKSEWIEVDSAFGGLAIYKSHLFSSDAKYVGVTKQNKRICEHVPFHSSLKDEGARIMINPDLINTRSTDHSLRLSFLFTLFRILGYPFKYSIAKRKSRHAE